MSKSKSSDIPWAIESKFEPCRPSLSLVPRARLTKLLDEGLSKRLVLVTAPAGYGKSSLLGQWAEAAATPERYFTWVTLESGETDPKRFLAYIVLALHRAGLLLDELASGARDGFAEVAVQTVLAKLIGAMSITAKKIILVLEDFHVAESSAVQEIVQRLVKDVSSDFTLYIDTRQRPSLDAFAMIASGDAIEISASQLMLTRDETLAVLNNVVDEETGKVIHQKTEGWPVAVQLALIQARTFPGQPISTNAKSGLIASYLTEQVLSSLDDDTRMFLLTVSFLSRFNADLTNHVMSQANAWQQVTALSPFAALILPLDDSGEWYRLHHLFAEYLREHLIRHDPATARAIRLKASEWYAGRGDLELAVRYGVYAEAFDECVELIRAAGGWRIILTEGIGVLRSVLRHLPQHTIHSSPSMLIARAYLHCKDGEIQEARAMLMAGVDKMEPDQDQGLQVDRVVVESMLNLYEDNEEPTADYIELRHRFLSEGVFSSLEMGTVYCEEVLAAMSGGDLSGSELALQKAFAAMRQSGSVLGLNYCYIHAAHLALLRADFDLASANVERALDMADENFGSDSGLKNLAKVLAFSLDAWRGSATVEALEEFEVAFDHIIENDGWVDIYMTGLEGFLLYSAQLDKPQPAIRILRKLDFFAQRKALPRLRDCVLASYLELQARTPNSQIEGVAGARAKLSGLRGSTSNRAWSTIIILATLDEETSLRKNAIEFAHKAGAHLALQKIDIAVAQQARGTGSDLRETVLPAVKAASRFGVAGPFVADPWFHKALSRLRVDLLQDERELITVRFIDRILTAKTQSPDIAQDGPFSHREREVLQQLASGKSNKEIARALELTENTVKFHLKSIYSKLSVHKRTQAVLEAQKRGLIDEA